MKINFNFILLVLVTGVTGCCAIDNRDEFEGAKNYWVGRELSNPMFNYLNKQSTARTPKKNDNVEYAFAKDEESFFDDVIGQHLDNLRVFGYNYTGYSARIDSVPAYYKASMDLLDIKTWRNLFFNGELRIHTKILDEAPAKYLAGAMVANSMVANGCIVDGTVENSILSRQVKVGRNAVIRNSIIMQNCVIGDDARLDGVICDKNGAIQAGAVLKGTPEKPLCIAKFALRD